MDEESKQDFLDFIKPDIKNMNEALDQLIDSVSTFKSNGSEMFTDDSKEEEWVKMQDAIDFAKFIFSGLMYSHGIPTCFHEEEEDDD